MVGFVQWNFQGIGSRKVVNVTFLFGSDLPFKTGNGLHCLYYAQKLPDLNSFVSSEHISTNFVFMQLVCGKLVKLLVAVTYQSLVYITWRLMLL